MLWPVLMPTNSLYYWQNPEGPRDLIIFSGIEPQMRWQSYAEVIADMAGYYNDTGSMLWAVFTTGSHILGRPVSADLSTTGI
jgi:proteasome assembly chaperone (PAC2) family protein